MAGVTKMRSAGARRRQVPATVTLRSGARAAARVDQARTSHRHTEKQKRQHELTERGWLASREMRLARARPTSRPPSRVRRERQHESIRREWFASREMRSTRARPKAKRHRQAMMRERQHELTKRGRLASREMRSARACPQAPGHRQAMR